MEAYLIYAPKKIPSRKQINSILHKERKDEQTTSQILLQHVPAVLVQMVNCYWLTIPIPDFYRPRVCPLSYGEDGYRVFLFELACWWFESMPINLAQFLQVANVCRWMLRPLFCGQVLFQKRAFSDSYREDGQRVLNLYCTKDKKTRHSFVFQKDPKVIACVNRPWQKELFDLSLLQSILQDCQHHEQPFISQGMFAAAHQTSASAKFASQELRA